MLYVVSSDDGRLITQLAVGDNMDTTAFDAVTGLIFTSSDDGLITVMHQDNLDSYRIVDTRRDIPSQLRCSVHIAHCRGPTRLEQHGPHGRARSHAGCWCSSAVNDPHALSYVNLNCLVFPLPATRRGNLGRNTLTGPGLESLDVSFRKDNIVRRLSDQFKVQFRVDLFNLLNHSNFAPPLSHQVGAALVSD
jgi:hypothetical protein